MVSMTALTLALLLVGFDGPKPPPSPGEGDPVALFLLGKREEALEAAKKLVAQKPTNLKEQAQLGQLAFAQGLDANNHRDPFLAEERFKTAASHYLKAGKSEEAALSLGQQAFCLTVICKFKESELIQNQAFQLSGQANQKDNSQLAKILREQEARRKTLELLAESDDILKKDILDNKNNSTTPKNLQLKILVNFGNYFQSTEEWESAHYCLLNAQKLSDTHPIASEEKKQEIRINLAKVKSKLKETPER